jgi:TLD
MATTADQEELMLRLQSQFGDMDLTNLLDGAGAKETSDSEESSLAEPSPEELRAWQEAQFQKGKAQVEAKKDATKSAVQRRREELAKGEDDWEALPALPDLRGQSSAFFPTMDHDGAEIVGVHPLLQQLSAADDILGTTWKRLFSSTHGDGLSFGNLWTKVHGYAGPTVLLVGAIPSASKALSKHQSTTTTTTTTTLGFFSTSPWSACESSDCFLFAYDEQEDIHFFRPRRPDHPTQQPYMHCLSSAQATNVTQGGIFIGGAPRVHLTETLEECRAMDYCSQFEVGDLLLGHAKDSLNYFDATQIEVWAVGGEEWIQESLLTQTKHQAIGEANRLRAQKVDKHQFLQDFQGGLMSTSGKPGGLFAHYDYNTERCDM